MLHKTNWTTRLDNLNFSRPLQQLSGRWSCLELDELNQFQSISGTWTQNNVR